ncbi:hypothetical protein HBH98_182100 [Parastagonospora nodorum]|nr:hypothetical protein HBH53_231670 [Parastagonospora nodorum]KAH3956091.1 hypothetical protein HBH51_255640 [Parastagonospora nodorum]KAH4215692.1 hypothetical protein HBI06_244810 [Parastagonospora nodorum]KAH4224483.1 hypothetical protein HBI05_237080 [Parastagonospora nodorum]KAH4341239.1 hypothetical protein HBH98_182100 [Parastagonospora nodorum]
MMSMTNLPAEVLGPIFSALVLCIGVKKILTLRSVCGLWAELIPIELLRNTPTEILLRQPRNQFVRRNLSTFIRLRAYNKPYPIDAPGKLFCIVRRVVRLLDTCNEIAMVPSSRDADIRDTCDLLSAHFLHAYVSATRPAPTDLLNRLSRIPVEELVLVIAAHTGRDHLIPTVTVATPWLVFRRIAGLACPLTLAITAGRLSTIDMLLSKVQPDPAQKPPRWLATRLDNEILRAHISQSYRISRHLIYHRLQWQSPGPPAHIICDWIRMAALSRGHSPTLLNYICDQVKQRSSRLLTSYAVALITHGKEAGSLRLSQALLERGLLDLNRKYCWLPENREWTTGRSDLESLMAAYKSWGLTKTSVLSRAVADSRPKLVALLLSSVPSKRNGPHHRKCHPDGAPGEHGVREYPILSAIQLGRIDLVDLLLDYGANPTVGNTYPKGNTRTVDSSTIQHDIDIHNKIEQACLKWQQKGVATSQSVSRKRKRDVENLA